MTTVTFPASLPSPSVVSMSVAERRKLSSITDGLQQQVLLQSDFLGYENLQWEFTAPQALVFDDFWTNTLAEGGRWFQAAWPRISVATSGVCRFMVTPHWELVGFEYWRVTIATELRGVALPPKTNALVLGLHLDGSPAETAPRHSASELAWTYGSLPILYPTGTAKFAFASNARFRSEGNPLVSDNRGKFIFNKDGQFQISVWVKPTVGAFGYSGGRLVELLSWGHPNGNAMVSGPTAPGPTNGQLLFDLEGNSSGAPLLFDYPAYDPVSGTFLSGRLLPLVDAVYPTIPVDGAWHHIGIAGDIDGIRAYFDGVLCYDDGSRVPENLRPAGSRPMWAGTAYSDQRFLIGAAFAGTYSSASPDPYSNFPTGIALSRQFSGDVQDLEIRVGNDCTTYVGASITVPTATFVR